MINKYQRKKNIIKKKKKKIKIYEFITIYDLSILIKISYSKIIKICNNLGIIVTINDKLDFELITLICQELNIKVKILKNDDYNLIYKKYNSKKKKIINRAPIVTIMGHVNHGKTSLLDYIRKSNLIKLEYGKITQHIGIYNIKIKKKSITFIDTPGHDSFISIRRISSLLSDIALIIISSDNGLMKQTIESINHAKSNNLPIIFGFSKIDKKNSNIEIIKKQLLTINIDINNYLYQKFSIKTGYGIDELINKILLLSNSLKLIANINTICSGRIIESTLNKKGYIVKVLIQEGILKKNEYIISGIFYGKIKNIYDDNNKSINNIYPSLTANVIGFNGNPNIGDIFKTFNKEYYIKNICNKRKLLIKKQKIKIKNYLFKKKKYINLKKINVILKYDVENSNNAICEELNKLKFNNYYINIIKKSVGNITESDYNLAETFNSIIIGYNVKNIINNIKKKKKINIYIFNIIYDIINFLNKKINNLNKKKNILLGTAKIIKIFNIKNQKIFGCNVLKGKIYKKYNIKIKRNNKILIDNIKIKSLKIYNKDVILVKKDNNFGLIINNFDFLKINDIIESYK